MNFYKHYPGDYARGTAHLSLAEHGAYRLMLDQFYGAGRPLPGNRKSLYRLLRAETADEKRAVDNVAIGFWVALPAELDPLYELLGLRTEEDRRPLRIVIMEWTEVGGLINVRALGEMVKARLVAEKNKQTAIEREQKRRLRVVPGGRS